MSVYLCSEIPCKTDKFHAQPEKLGKGGGVLTSSRAICLTWPLEQIKHNNVSWSHSERWRSQENRSCLSQLLSLSALSYGSYYLLTGFSTLCARSKHSKSSRSLLQRTDRREREREICPEATVTPSGLIWKVRCSPSPRLSQLCALLCWVKLPDSPGKDVPSTAKPAQGGLFQKDIGFSLGEPCSLHVQPWSVSCPENITGSFTGLATETDWFL